VTWKHEGMARFIRNDECRNTHEFITAILEDREPMVNVYEALAMTVPGILAHQSAMKNGETLKVPQYDRAKA
jgi:hypothetical protein